MKRLAFLLAAFPMALALGLVLTLSEALSGATRLLRPGRRSSIPAPSPPVPEAETAVSIIVLNWNGRALLEESLPVLDSALRRTSVLHEEFQIAHIEAAVPSGGFALRTNSRLLSSKSRFASSGREMGN